MVSAINASQFIHSHVPFGSITFIMYVKYLHQKSVYTERDLLVTTQHVKIRYFPWNARESCWVCVVCDDRNCYIFFFICFMRECMFARILFHINVNICSHASRLLVCLCVIVSVAFLNTFFYSMRVSFASVSTKIVLVFYNQLSLCVLVCVFWSSFRFQHTFFRLISIAKHQR